MNCPKCNVRLKPCKSGDVDALGCDICGLKVLLPPRLVDCADAAKSPDLFPMRSVPPEVKK